MGSQAKTTAGHHFFLDYDPSFDWARGEEGDIICVYLPGFKKDNLKVQVDSYGNLRMSGERSVDGGSPIRFLKDFRLPQNCKVDGIRAKLEKDALVIMIPKLVAATPAASEPKPANARHDKDQQASAKLPGTNPETPDRRARASIKESEKPKMEKKMDERGKRNQKEEANDHEQAISRPEVGGIVTLLLNMVVAVIVMVSLAIYVTSKLKDVKDTEW